MICPSDRQGAFIVLYTLEKLCKVALAKTATAACLGDDRRFCRSSDCLGGCATQLLHAANPLDNLQEYGGPVRYRRREDLQQDPLQKQTSAQSPCLQTVMRMPNVTHLHPHPVGELYLVISVHQDPQLFSLRHARKSRVRWK